MDDFNRNEKQLHFSGIKGVLKDIEQGDKFCNITIVVGHEKKRFVNFIIKKEKFPEIASSLKINEKYLIFYYLTSKKLENKWTTMATMLSIKPTA